MSEALDRRSLCGLRRSEIVGLHLTMTPARILQALDSHTQLKGLITVTGTLKGRR